MLFAPQVWAQEKLLDRTISFVILSETFLALSLYERS